MGRKAVKQKTISEKLIWTTWSLTKKGRGAITIEYGKVLAAIGLVMEVLEQFDRKKGTENSKLFIERYLSDDSISKKELTANKLYARSGIEILRNGEGLFYTILNIADETTMLINSSRKFNMTDLAIDFSLERKKVLSDTTWYMWLFNDFYNRLEFKL
ncbi:MAG: hypothetical protein FWE13_05925, partial [Firmicutes bacterium]|nr:hypothetical protein [Bacillota bacterium]